jgi:hypothetical protein
MEQQRSKKAKSLRAAGRKPVKNIDREINNILGPQVRYKTGLIKPHSSMKILEMKQRFALNGNFTSSFTMQDGHQRFLVATGTTTAISYADIWRIKEVKVFCRNNEQDASCQVAFTPSFSDPSNSNAINSVPKTYGLESQSSASAAILVYRPGRLDPMGLWHRTNNAVNTNLFTVQTSASTGAVDQNTLIDITFEYVINLNGGNSPYTVTGLGSLIPGALGALPIFGGLGALLDMNVL